MKFDKSVKKQTTPKGFRYYIEGPGCVDDSKPIDLAEEVVPTEKEILATMAEIRSKHEQVKSA